MRSTENKKYFACFGDSITSEQVTGIGTRVAELLGLSLTGNFACGYATMSDWHEEEKNITPLSLTEPMDTNTADNVLSNQVRRCLQFTAEKGAQIRWDHPLAGSFEIEKSIGTGSGHTESVPDVLYIAAGINDGNSIYNQVADDVSEVLKQPYGEFTTASMAGALRWAVETLRCAYPDALTFIAAPLYTWDSGFFHMSRGSVLEKREIIRKVAEYESAHFIDATFESGFSEQIAAAHGGVHPDSMWKEHIARFVAAEIRRYL